MEHLGLTEFFCDIVFVLEECYVNEWVFWQVLSSGRLPDSFVKGLQLTKWAGRAEVIHDPSGRLSFYLDGAHSPESMEACAHWFCSAIKSEENPEAPQLRNSSQVSILGTDGEKWNPRETMVRRVSMHSRLHAPESIILSFITPCITLSFGLTESWSL